jgi:hypothetical protein
MSGKAKDVIVDFTAFSLGIDRVRCVLGEIVSGARLVGRRLFLVPNKPRSCG